MKGYYSLIQYCPDVARREAANVGVMLLCPEAGFLDWKLKTSNHRIRRFFGEEADGYRFLNQMKIALASRLAVEREGLVSLESLTRFGDAWANKLSIATPRPVKVVSPAEDLLGLYAELVDEPVRDLVVRAEAPLRERMDAILGSDKLAPYVRTGIEVNVPTLKRTLKVPYGYQNGRFNLVVPEVFTQKSELRIEKEACALAVEGRSLYENPDANLGELQLIVVADFKHGGDRARETVDRMFDEYHVRLLPWETLESLEKEIVTHGKPHRLI